MRVNKHGVGRNDYLFLRLPYGEQHVDFGCGICAQVKTGLQGVPETRRRGSDLVGTRQQVLEIVRPVAASHLDARVLGVHVR